MTYIRQGNATLAATSATPSGAAGGDLGGTYPNPTVPGLATANTNIATNTANIATNTTNIASNTASIATKAGALTPTAVKTAAYTAAAGDLVPCDTTSGGFTVTLPSAPADKTVVAVKHVIQGSTNAVTVACGGTDVFNKASGSTTGSLALLNQALLLQYKASSGIWYVVSDDLSLASLDLRYLGIATAIPESQVTNLTTDLAAKAVPLTPTAVKTANYTAAANEFVPVDTTSGNVTVTLPTAPADKTRFGAKQVVRGGTNTVTIAAGGSDVFNVTAGSTTRTLTVASQAITLQYVASSAIWYVVAGDLPLSELDLRYLGISTAIPESQVTSLVADLAAKLAIQETVNTQSTITGTYTIPDVTTATMHRLTLTGNTTFTMPTAAAGKSFSVTCVQDGTGSRTATFTGVKWPGGAAPVLSTGAGKIDDLAFQCTDGTNWKGYVAGLDVR